MADQTASEVLTSVKTARENAELLKKRAGTPSDDVNGKFAADERAVTADENTANSMEFEFEGFTKITSKFVQIFAAADGSVITGDVKVTVLGNKVTVADGATKTIATGDLVNVLVKGE